MIYPEAGDVWHGRTWRGRLVERRIEVSNPGDITYLDKKDEYTFIRRHCLPVTFRRWVRETNAKLVSSER